MNKELIFEEPFFIIIRGPLGVGKTTISSALRKLLNAERISFDKVLEKNRLDRADDNFTPEDFIKANEIVLPKAKECLRKGRIVIFDGCFYFIEQINHLIENLNFKHYIFDLKASVKTCIKRDRHRKRIYGEKAARQVYNLVSRFDYGISIDTEKTLNKVLKTIISYLPKEYRLV